ncbi:MAG: nitroreductase family deazaflavin-dependent oxidoreductase [Anaerolineae bacterium]|nr:nitroreductase family deazaflavin-dependent oxidoreductase [Anaerolineae bacterium]
MSAFLNRIVNPFMKWLLKSPLHGIVSGHYMLVTVTGRKTGKLYTTPVEYRHKDQAIMVITSQRHTWWKNLQSGVPCTLWIKSKELPSVADVDSDPTAVQDAFHTIYPKMDEARIAKLMSGCIVITFTPVAT